MIRFDIDGKGINTNKWEEAYSMLYNRFTSKDQEQAFIATANSTPMKNFLYK